jgi:LPXTG-motif cell wall-anchored protein
MKKVAVLMILISTILISPCITSVNALNQNEWSSTLSWSNSVYYQGDSGSVTVHFDSSCPEELKISYVGVHFDWMSSDTYFPLDLSSSPVGIVSNGQYTFNEIGFNIPSGTSIGYHAVNILIKGQQHGLWWYDISVIGSGWVNIHNVYEKIYNQLYPDVTNKIHNADSSNFQSPDGKSLLEQANTEYTLANSLAQQGEWQDAVSHLQSASNYVDQAFAKEQTYHTDNSLPLTGQSSSLWLIIIMVIIIAVVVGVILGVMLQKRKHDNQPLN